MNLSRIDMETMHTCIISLAANCQQEKNLAEARRRLGQILSNIAYTNELWTKPVGRQVTPTAPLYLNQLVYAETDLSAEALERQLKEVEKEMGRTVEDKLLGKVCIDLDLMSYDQQRYHLKDWNQPYIQLLLKEECDKTF